MPHLRYNGRYWRVSSDELFVPGMLAITVRIFWSTLLIIILSYSTERLLRCPDGAGVVTYLYLSLALFISSIVCEACLVKKALIGSIVETSKREEGIGYYFLAHIILGCIQFILAIFGIFIVSAHSFIPCSGLFQNSQTYDLILLSVIVITQIVDISSLACCCYAFSANKESEQYTEDYDEAASAWESRCRSGLRCLQLSTCNIFGGAFINDDIKAVASVMTNFFHHDGFLDVVPSDVVSGIILVRAQQRAAKFATISEVASSSHFLITNPSPAVLLQGTVEHSSPSASANDVLLEEFIEDSDSSNQLFLNDDVVRNLSPCSVPSRKNLDIKLLRDRETVEAAADYAVYMIAIYTHLMVIFTQPCSGLWCLCYSSMKRSCCTCCSPYEGVRSSNSSTVKGDNLFGANHSGLTHFTRNVQSEVVYASYDNTTTAKPFAIFLNHKQRSVVISIRGSLSLEDCITDAIADPVEMTSAGKKWGFNGSKRYSHGGFLMAALSIREEIEQSQILQRILRPCTIEGASVHSVESNGEGKDSIPCQTDVENGVRHTKVSSCTVYTFLLFYYPMSIYFGMWIIYAIQFH